MINRFRNLMVGLYTMVVSVFWGEIILDMVYVRNLKGILGLSDSSLVFSEISDTLLFMGFIVIILAILAIIFSWNSEIAKYLFIASLLAFSFEFTLPVLSSIIKNNPGFSWIRFFPGGVASVLAFVGLCTYYRRQP